MWLLDFGIAPREDERFSSEYEEGFELFEQYLLTLRGLRRRGGSLFSFAVDTFLSKPLVSVISAPLVLHNVSKPESASEIETLSPNS